MIQIRIFVNVENGSVLVNDEAVPCHAPYVSDAGVTMLEASVITDAFGGEIQIDDNGVMKVTYAGVEMQCGAGSSQFMINGQQIEMPDRAVMADGHFMIPLRFFAESFGADVSYDTQTHDIVILGSPDSLGAEVDFHMILKYSGKSKIGNSKEKWRFSKPNDFDMDDYWGEYVFYIEDISASMYVQKNTEHMTADQMYASLQAMWRVDMSRYFSAYGVTFHCTKGVRAGIPYVSMKERHTDGIREYHGFVTDDFAYFITAFIPITHESFAQSKDNATIAAFLDSFEADYTGGGEDTVDLATQNITAPFEQKEMYKDGNYAWTVKLADGWAADEYYGFSNVVSIARSSSLNKEEGYPSYNTGYYYDEYRPSDRDEEYVSPAVLTVYVYSNPANQPLEDWANSKIEYQKSLYNEKFLSISAVSDTKLGERAAKTFSQTTNYGTYTRCTDWYFLARDKFRYMLKLDYDKRDSEQEGFLDGARAMVQSFEPADINFDDYGDALEADNYLVTDKITKQCDNKMLSLTMPYLWSLYSYNDEVTISSDDSSMYGNFGDHLTIFKTPLDQVDDEGNVTYLSLAEMAKKSFVATKKQYLRNMVAEVPVTETTFKGRTAYTYSYVINQSDSMGKVKNTVSAKVLIVALDEKDCFVITIQNSELNSSPRINNVYESIIQSIQFK